MFPLLKLPLLCIQEVTDQWDVIELISFSFLSKRAKRISKRRKRNDFNVNLKLNSCSPSLHCDYSNPLPDVRYHEGQELIRSSDISSFLENTQHFMDILNCPFERVRFQLEPLITNDQLIGMINWLNGMKNDINEVWIQSATSQMFESIIKRFRKRIRNLNVYEAGFQHGGIVHKRLNFEVNHIFTSTESPWIRLDFIFSMNLERISAIITNLSAKDLNLFLKSWQEGKTNQRLKRFLVTTRFDRDIKKVLKGCKAELMDPRTTKLKVRTLDYAGYKDVWIHGGIHIKGNDGRLAVIQNHTHKEEVAENRHF
uniref:FBA_2 domain-containing protein n=1 Tax=Caenorhabditis tropicalis TaxID=1561998 RepID=A0A1I7V1C1_9PELO